MEEKIVDTTIEEEVVKAQEEGSPTVVEEVEKADSEQEETTEIGEGDAEEKATEEKPFDLQQFLKIPEVKDFVQKVRKEEKDKLYAEIQKKEGRIKELEGELVTMKESFKNTEKSSTDTQESMQQMVKSLEEKVDSLVKENREKELALYRANALKDAGDDIILDLVGGDSEEAIDASIENAKAKYLEVVEKATSKKSKVEVPKPSNPQQAPTVKQLTPDEISKMSASDWAKHREAIKKQLGLTK